MSELNGRVILPYLMYFMRNVIKVYNLRPGGTTANELQSKHKRSRTSLGFLDGQARCMCSIVGVKFILTMPRDNKDR